jgi:hypothetical protein
MATLVERDGTLLVERSDRLRIIAVSALTVVALPLLVAQTRGEGTSSAAVVGPANELATRTAGPSPAATDAAAPSSTDGGFLGGPTTGPPATVIDIAVPSPKPDDRATGKAGFKRWAPGTVAMWNPCATALVKAGTTITVTNLDNGHSVQCVNVGSSGVPKGTDIVIQTEFFAQLGDLVQAPVPVELRW